MNPTEQSSPATGNPEQQIHLRLFYAGNSPNSLRALANMQMISERYLRAEDTVDYVDLWLHPNRGFAEGVLVTPTLRRIRPAPEVSIIGDLSNLSEVLLTLGLPR